MRQSRLQSSGVVQYVYIVDAYGTCGICYIMSQHIVEWPVVRRLGGSRIIARADGHR